MMTVLMWVLAGYSVLLTAFVARTQTWVDDLKREVRDLWAEVESKGDRTRHHLEILETVVKVVESEVDGLKSRVDQARDPMADVVKVIEAVSSGLSSQAQVLVPPPPEPSPPTPPPDEAAFVSPNFHFLDDQPDPTDEWIPDTNDPYDNANRAVMIPPGSLPQILDIEDEIGRAFGGQQ